MNVQKITKVSTEAIANKENFYKALGLTETFVEKVIALPDESRYQEKKVKKKDGSIRVVYAPHRDLKKLQRRINRKIFANEHIIEWPDYLYGSLKNDKATDGSVVIRDYVACAKRHSRAQSILTVDIKDFFDNIHKDIVKEVVCKFVSSKCEIIELLSDICCYQNRLVQGAPTSSYLANMSMHAIEPRIVRNLLRKNLIYTRFVDDITVSSKVFNYDFTHVLKVIEDALAEIGLFLNSDKISIRYAGGVPLTVHGLRVDYSEARLPSEEVKNIRANVRMIEKMASQYKVRTNALYQKEYARCMGRVNKLKRTGHNKHEEYLRRLKKVPPIASRGDILFIRNKLTDLVNKHSEQKDTYRYHKQYYWLLERLYILRKSFGRSAEEMIDELNKYKPRARD